MRIEEGIGGGVIARGFCDGAAPPPAQMQVERLFDAAPRTRTFMASREGIPIGGGRLMIHGDLALLYGTSVLPEARRQGVHDALLRARINMAAAEGCDLVVVEGTPGGTTERNARRLGFDLALAQVVFGR